MFTKLTALPLLALLALLWGSSYSLIDVAVETIPPTTATAGRLFFALVLMGILMRRGGQVFPRDRKVWRLYIAIALWGFTGPFFLLSWGQVHIASGLTAILISSVPIFTFLITGLVTRRERFTVYRAAGIALGFVGIVVLFGPAHLRDFSTTFWAKLAIVTAALSFAIANTFAMSLRRGLAPVVNSTAVLLVATLAMTPFALVVDRPWQLQFEWQALALLAVAGAASTGLAAAVFFRIVDTAGVTFASLANYLVPLVGVGVGLTLLGEALHVEMLAALGLILAGVGLATRQRVRDDDTS